MVGKRELWCRIMSVIFFCSSLVILTSADSRLARAQHCAQYVTSVTVGLEEILAYRRRGGVFSLGGHHRVVVEKGGELAASRM